jgi:hypothetical protein
VGLVEQRGVARRTSGRLGAAGAPDRHAHDLDRLDTQAAQCLRDGVGPVGRPGLQAVVDGHPCGAQSCARRLERHRRGERE